MIRLHKFEIYVDSDGVGCPCQIRKNGLGCRWFERVNPIEWQCDTVAGHVVAVGFQGEVGDWCWGDFPIVDQGRHSRGLKSGLDSRPVETDLLVLARSRLIRRNRVVKCEEEIILDLLRDSHRSCSRV